jgi:opacity protein-like surface antigen
MKRLLAGAAIAAMMTGPALAVDLVLPEDDIGGFAWDGFYAGVVGGFWSGNSVYVYGGAQFGANYLLDGNFLLGFDGRALIYSDGDIGFDGAGRFGMAFDRVLVFVDGGFGVRDGSGHVFGGGGVEFALVENLSLAGRVEFVTGSGFNAVRAETSLLFHF